MLQIDVAALIGRDPVRRPESVNCIDQGEVAAIRAALERYDRITAFHVTVSAAPPITDLRKSVDHAWMTFQRSRYGVLAVGVCRAPRPRSRTSRRVGRAA